MADTTANSILAVNRGSSSLKFALFLGEKPVLEGQLERIHQLDALFHVVDATGTVLLHEPFAWDWFDIPRRLVDWLSTRPEVKHLKAIGHRIVHGGERFTEPHLVSDGVLKELNELVPLAPDHLPGEIAAIHVFARSFPGVPQVACFDTAFHHRMPPASRTFPLPPELGVVRYGFHGLSYEFILESLSTLSEVEANGRLIIAHLGNGASMAAVNRGIGVDTTMGFSPTGGLVMGSRSGDLDPGVLLHYIRKHGSNAADLSDLVNHRAGLLGVSGFSSDMRDLLEKEHENPRAALAVDLFRHSARKHIGALATVLGGLDTLIFTGGIGAHSSEMRRRICVDMEFLGIRLHPEKNLAHAPIISAPDAAVKVRVMKTDEELMIVRHCESILAQAKKK